MLPGAFIFLLYTAVDAFGMACETRGKRTLGERIGLVPVFGSMALAIGYTVVMGWIFKYMAGTFTGAPLAPDSVDGFSGSFGAMASAFGNNGWQIVALVLTFAIVIFVVGGGIERANKVMMPVFFFLFLGPVSYTHLDVYKRQSMIKVFEETRKNHSQIHEIFGFRDGIYYHTLILNAIKEGNADKARAWMFEHLQNAMDQLKDDGMVVKYTQKEK